MKGVMLVVTWFILNVLIGFTMDFALFTQTTSSMRLQSIFTKILSSEFWATIEWMFVIPANRLGYLFLNPAQLSLSSYIFDFMAQLWSNIFWLHLPTPIDDYVGMVIIFLGMAVSKLQLCG